MKKTLVVGAVTIGLVIGVAAPAMAGDTGWTSVPLDYVGSTEHGQGRHAPGVTKAWTKHHGWANLMVQGKYVLSGGQTYYTSTQTADNLVVVYSAAVISQHRSQW